MIRILLLIPLIAGLLMTGGCGGGGGGGARQAPAASLSISSAKLPDGRVGDAYSSSLSASGGEAPYTWAVSNGNLPPGLTLIASSGTIQGTPTNEGTEQFEITVTDNIGATDAGAFQIEIIPAMRILPADGAAVTVESGQAFGPVHFSLDGGSPPATNWRLSNGQLPAGLAFHTGTAVLDGTPTTAEQQVFSISVDDSTGVTATGTYTVTVVDPFAWSTTPGALPSGTEGSGYPTQTLTATGGETPYTWTILSGRLPAGLSLNSGNGRISGTPTESGSFSFTVQVADSGSRSISGNWSVDIAANPDGFVGVENGHFKVSGTRWYPYGINYWPHYGVNAPAGSGFSGPDVRYWQGDAYYDSAAIEADLTMMENAGFNCISIQTRLDSTTYAAIRDVLNRCANHNIKVFLSIPWASPLNAPLGKKHAGEFFDAFVATNNLADHEAIFAWDVSWEPHLGQWQDERNRWDQDYTWWLYKEYGSITAAQNAIGSSLPGSRNIATDASGIVSHNLPVRAVAGQTYNCTVVMRNTGGNTWSTSNYKLGTVYGTGGPGRVPASASTPIGQDATFSFSYTAPSNPGRHDLYLQAVHEGVRWFGSVLRWQVEVVGSGPAIQKTITHPTPVVAPADDDLKSTGTDNRVFAYRRAIDHEISVRHRIVLDHMRSVAPNHLYTCRQGYGGNGSRYIQNKYPLELISTAQHFDFLCPENYAFLGTLNDADIRGPMALLEAYSRWASGGKPVFWAEAGYKPLPTPTAQHNLEQGQYYGKFIDQMLATNADGVIFWWWPGGLRVDENSDYGITEPNRAPRPAFTTMDSKSTAATRDRAVPSPVTSGTVNLFGDNSGFARVYEDLKGPAATAVGSGRRYVVQGDGAGKDSTNAGARVAGFTKHLWAEFTSVELKIGSGVWIPVEDGRAYAVPSGTGVQLRATVINRGDATWKSLPAGTAGRVALGGKEAFGLGFRKGISRDVARLESIDIPAFTITGALTADTEIFLHMVADQVAWMNGGIHFRLFTY